MGKLDSYKVLASNDDHFEVEKDGRKFKVAKKHLDEMTKSRIQGMYEGGMVPHMAGGGAPGLAQQIGQKIGQGLDVARNAYEDRWLVPLYQAATGAAKTVGDFGSGVAQGFNPPKPQQEAPAVELGPKLASGNGVITEVPKTVPPEQQVAISSPQAAVAGAQAAGVDPQRPDPMEQYISQQKEAITQKQLAEEQQARDEVKAYQDQQKALADVAEQHAAARKPVDDQIKAVSDAVINGQVNPNRYYENRSTGNQVTGAIALILGGLAGGLDRTGRNPALEALNKAIDRDIESQRENLGNKRSALNQLMAQGKDIDEASNIQRLNALTAAGAQLALAAAKAKDPMAKANAAQAKSVLDLQVAELKQKQAAKNLEKSILAPGGTAVNPALLGGDYAKTYGATTVQGPDGRFYQARTPEAAGKLSQQMALSDQVRGLVGKLQNYGPEALAGGAASTDAAALKIALLKLNDISGIKEGALKLVAEQFDDPTKFKDLFIGGQSEALLNNVQRAIDSDFRNSTLNYSGAGGPLTTIGPAEFARTKGAEAAKKLAQNSKK